MKIYIPNLQDSLNKIGGGFTFLKNFHKGLKTKVEFVNNWKDCDIIFIFGITTIDKTEVHNAINAGKKLVLRVDNIPRKSRNRRQSPTERLKEFGNKAEAVIYQSQWCKNYAGYFIEKKQIIRKTSDVGTTEQIYKSVLNPEYNEYIINNGVDTSIFNSKGRNSDSCTYVYINYNDNPNKRFDEALYWFDMEWRDNNNAHLIIAGQAPKVYIDHPEFNWDLPTNGKVEYVGIMNSPEQVSNLMKTCDYLLYPSFAEAYPNTLLEAMACGVRPVYMNTIGGTVEAYKNSIIETEDIDELNKCNIGIGYKTGIKVKTIEEMCNEYLEVFKKLI